MPNCSILQCDNSSTSVADALKAGVSYYCFPKDTAIRDKWIEATGRQNWTPSKSSKICSQHFDAQDLRDAKNGVIRLKEHAVPLYKIMNRPKRLSKRNNPDISTENQTSPSKEKPSTSTAVQTSRKRTRHQAAGRTKRARKRDDKSAGDVSTEAIEVKKEPIEQENIETIADEPTSTTRIKSEPVQVKLEPSPAENHTYISFHTPFENDSEDFELKSEIEIDDQTCRSPRSRARAAPRAQHAVTSPRRHNKPSAKSPRTPPVTSPRRTVQHTVTSAHLHTQLVISIPRCNTAESMAAPLQATQQSVTSPRRSSPQSMTSLQQANEPSMTSPQVGSQPMTSPRKTSRRLVTSPRHANPKSKTSPQQASKPSMSSPQLSRQPSMTSPRKTNHRCVTSPRHASQKSKTSPQQASKRPTTSAQQASQPSMTSPPPSVTSPRRDIRQYMTSTKHTEHHLVTSPRRSTRQTITSPSQSQSQLISSVEKSKKLTEDENTRPAKVDEITMGDENTCPDKVIVPKRRIKQSQQKLSRYLRKQTSKGEENTSSVENIDGQKSRSMMSDTSREVAPLCERDVNVSPRRSKRVTHTVTMATSPLNSTQITEELENTLEVALQPVSSVSGEKDKNMVQQDQNAHVDKRVSKLPQKEDSQNLPRLCKTIDGNSTASMDSSSQPSGNFQSSEPAISKTSDSPSSPTSILDSSAFDSDFDLEYDSEENAATGGNSRYIPNDEEMDEADCEIVNLVENTMDEAYEDILGVSTEFNWSEDFTTFHGSREKFSGPTPGPIKDYNTPYDAFMDIWTGDIVQYIVLETNRYAEQEIQSRKATGTLPVTYSWMDTDINEMYLLFAIFIFMGLDPRLLETDFWTDGYLELSKLRQMMSHSRYRQLYTYLHFEDHDGSRKYQSEKYATSARLQKIAPIIGHLNKRFSTLYNLCPNVVIDESLTLFKGGPWIQAVRTKPSRVGVKSFELCDPNTGYLYKFLIHRNENNDEIHESGQDLARKSAEAVVDLLSGLENRGHCVVMDNFFNSPMLARYLKSRGFDCYGTLRPNRKYTPTDIQVQNLAKGSIIARHSGDISCIAWKDTKVITMISTCHDTHTVTGRKSGRNVVRPAVMHNYKHVMSSIDFKDQKLSTFLVERKRFLKWSTKIFRRLFNASVLNAHVLFQVSCARRNIRLMSQRQFREKLADSLVMKFRYHSPNMTISVKELRLNKDLVHAPKKNEKCDRKSCVVCLRKGINKKVYVSCVVCRVYLCFEDCWADWHYREKLLGEDYERLFKILNSA